MIDYQEIFNTDGITYEAYRKLIDEKLAEGITTVLAPIKQEYSFKFQGLIKRLIFSLELCVYPGSISPLV